MLPAVYLGPIMHVTDSVPFTIEQLETLMRWADAPPVGLNVSIATDHLAIDEVAELWREERHNSRYYLVRLASGMIEVGSVFNRPILASNLDDALSMIEDMEQADFD